MEFLKNLITNTQDKEMGFTRNHGKQDGITIELYSSWFKDKNTKEINLVSHVSKTFLTHPPENSLHNNTNFEINFQTHKVSYICQKVSKVVNFISAGNIWNRVPKPLMCSFRVHVAFLGTTNDTSVSK